MKRLSLFLLAALLTLTGCHTTKNAQQTHGTKTDTAEMRFKRLVAANAQTQPCLTARTKVNVALGGKTVSCSGVLRMKRGDVVQLSLSFLGMEVGRLEFTPQDVLVVDRVNKQYVRAAYSDVAFLRQSGLDFAAVEALFRGELFVPGAPAAESLERFAVSSAGDHTLLQLTDAPKLDYEFLAITKSALIDRVSVQGKTTAQQGQLVCKYGQHTNVGGKPFPQRLELNFGGAGKDLGLTLSLSRLDNAADWPTRTTVKNTYRQRSADEILGQLVRMGQ